MVHHDDDDDDLFNSESVRGGITVVSVRVEEMKFWSTETTFFFTVPRLNIHSLETKKKMVVGVLLKFILDINSLFLASMGQ